ncbi:hypothetical protein Glove_212g231 [Diversispora epigaea]|uniref:Uncharacterized protein n=1 Tax=Diversispora epigaea TaxID=1348612 RepID=A0A397IPJ9_9GLOM|nr:hypothetical protein Glove_212g231 [Diversispora epigaea]
MGIENQQWGRYDKDTEVALKKFDNSVNFNDVINEIQATHRSTFKELDDGLEKYYNDYEGYFYYGKNKDSEIVIQIKKAEEFSANQELNNTTTTTTTSLNYQTHPQAIYTSRLLNYSKLPKPKNEENFEKELEELTESMSLLIRI